jgi:hypothetical protein
MSARFPKQGFVVCPGNPDAGVRAHGLLGRCRSPNGTQRVRTRVIGTVNRGLAFL